MTVQNGQPETAFAPLSEGQRAALSGFHDRVGTLRLVIIHGEPLGSVLAAPDEALVGRDDSASLPILHSSISRQHAMLRKDGGGWFVEDCGSTNGTYVNGARVTTRCPLRQGDIIAFGAVVLKVYVTEPRTRERTETAGNVDALTGAFTRSYLDERLAAEVAESYRRRQPVSLAYVDIDRLALVNETHGNEVGDAALREAAILLRDRLRRADILARYDGDEFVAILSEVPLSLAVRIGRRLLKALRSHPLQVITDHLHITASIGIASTDGRWISAEELLTNGREAMLRARQRGGDKVAA